MATTAATTATSTCAGEDSATAPFTESSSEAISGPRNDGDGDGSSAGAGKNVALGEPAAPASVSASADTFARHSTSSPHGRGSLSGWAPCPLCNPPPTSSSYEGSKSKHILPPPSRKSRKVYALGRGIASHLREVHRPWNPGKAERKRRMTEWRRRKNLRKRTKKKCDGGGAEGEDHEEPPPVLKWDPTPLEVEEWERRVLEITAEVDRAYALARGNGRDAAVADVVETEEAGASLSDVGSGRSDNGRSGDDDGSALPPPRKRRRAETRNGSLLNTAGGGSSFAIGAGRDRNGNAARSYRDSLPPFIRAAADGDAGEVRRLAEAARSNRDGKNCEEEFSAAVAALLESRDRNGSTAEHWAAGGGHLDCLEALEELRRNCCIISSSTKSNADSSSFDGKRQEGGAAKVRRRDGKTALHYAARNGHVHVIDYLLSGRSGEDGERKGPCADARNDDGGTPSSIGADDADGNSHVYRPPPSPRRSVADVPSGDGTTPLHLACYTSSLPTVRHLISRYSADPCLPNEWGCDASHWSAMSVHPTPSAAVEVCEYLRSIGVKYHESQRQGHTAAHKAAQRKNGEVLRWMVRTMSEKERAEAGKPDAGGNRPSDIWRSVGGDEEFAEWLRKEARW